MPRNVPETEPKFIIIIFIIIIFIIIIIIIIAFSIRLTRAVFKSQMQLWHGIPQAEFYCQ